MAERRINAIRNSTYGRRRRAAIHGASSLPAGISRLPVAARPANTRSTARPPSKLQRRCGPSPVSTIHPHNKNIAKIASFFFSPKHTKKMVKQLVEMTLHVPFLGIQTKFQTDIWPKFEKFDCEQPKTTSFPRPDVVVQLQHLLFCVNDY